MRLVILSDLHYLAAADAAVGTRRGGMADLLLMRAVHRLNRLVRPDAVVLLGDLVNDGAADTATDLFSTLAGILERLECPWFAVPGNHDGDPARFADILGKTPDQLDVNGVRLVPFIDPEEPGYNARRESENLERMRQAAANAPGPVVALQHVPLFPPGKHVCPYNYVNAESVIRTMREAGIRLTVGAHYHPGIEAIQDGDRTFLACPALCEEPFRYLVLDIDAAGGVESRVEALATDPGLGLVDTHVHTQFAYCSENMDVARVLELAPLFGLAGIRFTEHSGHLYFSAREYPRSWEWGLGRARSEDRRLEEYLSALRAAGVPPARFGIEIDCCHNGAPLLESAARGQCPFQIGAMHSLPGLRPGTTASPGTLRNEFLAILETFLASGMKILAHPFRVFRRGGTAIPDDLFGPTVRLLRAHGTAAELNFHTNEPPPEFVAMCLEERVPLTFGSDAHNLYEIGAFALHLDLLRRCGFSGAPREVLLDVEG